jgi:hypothetical protein
MAEESENVLIGIEYTGSAAVEKFGADLSAVPAELGAVIKEMAAVAGKDENVVRASAKALAQAFIATWKLEMAEAQGLLSGVGINRGNFTSTAVGSLGLTDPKQLAAATRVIEQVRRQMDAGASSVLKATDLAPTIRALQQVESQADRTQRALQGAAAAQAKVSSTPTVMQRDLQAIQKAPVAPDVRERLTKQLAQDTPVRQAIVERRAAGDDSGARTLAADLGTTRYQVMAADKEYLDLIAALRQESAAHREAAEAARVRAVGGSGASMGLGAQITPWQVGRSAYWQTDMGQRFATQMGLPTSAFGGPTMPAADASWWQRNFMPGLSARLTEQVAALPKAEQRQVSPNPGFKQSFTTAFTHEDEPGAFGQMVGQTARVSLFYGVAYRALSALQQGLEQAVQETVAYEDALTSLNIVTGRTRSANEELAGTLSDIAAAAGYTPSQGVALGSKALGLYGVASADQATQEHTIEVSATVATRMARVANADPVGTQGQLAGALRSLGWGIDRLPELEDTISFISRQTGQAPTELLGAVSNIATLGTQAGFTPQQLAALVAQVGTTTGQNPESTAGQFRQLLSRSAPEIASQASGIVGVDLTGLDLQQIFAKVSQLSLSADQLNAFASLFGKGGSQQVATILTQQYGAVQKLSTEAQAPENAGFGRRAYDEAMTSFGNRVKELGGQFAQFGVALIETGVLDWLGALVVAITQLVEVGTKVLGWFNELPRPLRSVALALAEVYGAALLIGKTGIGAKALGGVAGTALDLLPTRVTNRVLSTSADAVTESQVTRLFARGAQGPLMADGRFATNQVSAATLRAALGTDVSALFAQGGPLRLSADARLAASQSGTLLGRAQGATGLTGLGMAGAVGAAALAAGTIYEGFKVTNDAQARVDEARAALAAAKSLDELRDATALARNSMQDLRQEGLEGLKTGDVVNLIPALMTSLLTGGEKKALQETADEGQRRADALQQYRDTIVAADKSNVFQDFSVDGINSTLKELTDQGYNASERLELLNRALFDFTKQTAGAKDAFAVLNPEERTAVGAKSGQILVDAVSNAKSLFQVSQSEWTYGVNTDRKDRPSSYALGEAIDRFTLSSKDETALRDAMARTMEESLATWSAGGVIDKEDVDRIVADVQSGAQTALGKDRWNDLVKDGQVELFKSMLSSQVRGMLAGFGGTLTRDSIAGFMQVAPQVAQARGELVQQQTGSSPLGNEATLAALQKNRDDLMAVVDQSGSPLTEEEQRDLANLDLSILQWKRTVLSDRIQAIQTITGVAQSRLADDDVFGRLTLSQQSVAQQRAADAGNAPSILNGGKWDPAYAQREAARQAQEVADAKALAQANLQGTQNRNLANVGANDALGRSRVEIENSRLYLNSLTAGSPEYWAAVANLNQAQFAYAQANAQNTSANALANIDPRDNLARINQQIANARREMALLPSNQRGQYREQIAQLNQQYQEGLVSQANAAATAGIAGNRSSIDQARVNLANANRSLGIQLQGTESYYSALSGVREAQSALAQAEREQADRVARLGSDLTNPVEQARLDVEKARAQLTADQASGQGPDVVTQDQLDLKNAQNTQEAAAFNQRISDLQTAEDLGRISHTAYMSYLQAEHDRLSAVANRTRQQQEQLDQVDKLMKSASEQIQGQFNIGDIKLPTIYEVRRAIASNAPTSVADYSHSNNVININGAPLEQVLEYLETYLGAGAQVVTATAGRKI